MSDPQAPKQLISLIVNPTAGRGAAGRALPRIRQLLTGRYGNAAEYHLTSGRGDAERIAARALREGATVVAAMGGDGTLHEVANAFVQSEKPQAASLALLPYGTGNDFARAVGLRGGAEIAIDTLFQGKRRMIDVGMIESPSLPAPRLFLVAAGIGFVADTAHTVNTSVRYLTGPAAYVYGAVKTLRGFRSVHARLSFDGAAASESNLSLISVSNVATTGGGIRIAPEALPDDGVFDVCVVDAMPKLELFSKLPLAFSGRHVRDAKVALVRCRKLDIATEQPCALWIDGEVTGTTPASFRILPNALPMLLPEHGRA